jgi:homoserine acetyltransferase
MASEREQAKSAITARTSEEPELEEKLSQAHALQHRLESDKEAHRHKEAMRAAELGWFGRILGGEATASLTVAFIVVCVGLFTAVGCLGMAAYAPSTGDFWAKQSERSIAVAMAALSFIFGKTPRPSR